MRSEQQGWGGHQQGSREQHERKRDERERPGAIDWLTGSTAAATQAQGDRPRSRLMCGCLFAIEMIGLAVVFATMHLHTGLWAIPAFLPLLAWCFCCAFAGRTLRPLPLARLRGGRRLAALAATLLGFCAIWPMWAGPAHGAWQAGHGGLSSSPAEAEEAGGEAMEAASSGPLAGFPGGSIGMPALPSIPRPSFPYGAVLDASPTMLVLVAAWLIALGMLGMPGKAGQSRPDASDTSSRIL